MSHNLIMEYPKYFKYPSVEYRVDGAIAYIQLARPHAMNAIDFNMPANLRIACSAANSDPDVHCIVLSGEGANFCAGYDVRDYAESTGDLKGTQDPPVDFMKDFKMMNANTRDFMSLHNSYKPTIVALRGYCVGGGTDIALCADIMIVSENSKIGYPPSRVWGIPQTGLWMHRVGEQQAKRMLFTGDLITGKEAADIGLALKCVPDIDLDAYVSSLAQRIACVPKNQLMMSKLLINSALENQGLATSQTLATMFDGLARHSPEGVYFKNLAEKEGFQKAVAQRDSGKPFIPKGVSKL
jgi:enoyl-CoA hydratase